MMVTPQVTLARRAKPIDAIDEHIVNARYLPLLHRAYIERRDTVTDPMTDLDGTLPIEALHRAIVGALDYES